MKTKNTKMALCSRFVLHLKKGVMSTKRVISLLRRIKKFDLIKHKFTSTLFNSVFSTRENGTDDHTFDSSWLHCLLQFKSFFYLR